MASLFGRFATRLASISTRGWGGAILRLQHTVTVSHSSSHRHCFRVELFGRDIRSPFWRTNSVAMFVGQKSQERTAAILRVRHRTVCSVRGAGRPYGRATSALGQPPTGCHRGFALSVVPIAVLQCRTSGVARQTRPDEGSTIRVSSHK